MEAHFNFPNEQIINKKNKKKATNLSKSSQMTLPEWQGHVSKPVSLNLHHKRRQNTVNRVDHQL